MRSFMPAPNVIFAFFGGLITWAVLAVCAHFGYTPSPDVANGLPYATALALAHAWDVYTGDNAAVKAIRKHLLMNSYEPILGRLDLIKKD